MRFPLVVLAVSLIFIACNSENPEVEKLKIENAQLRSEKAKNDSIMNQISGTYTEIDSNLMRIELKKQNISALARKGRLTSREKQFILAEMDSINLLLMSNREKVDALDSSLGDNKIDNLGYNQMVKGLDDKNSSSDIQLESMKGDLASMSEDFSNLFEDYVYKEAENMEMQEKLSSAALELEAAQKNLDLAHEKLKSAWYIVGTRTDLKEKGLLLKTGFFEDHDMSEDVDKSLFKKIDISQLNEIILDSKKAKLVTNHPSESYELLKMKKKVNRLVIKDPDKFWSVSKFLIIEVE